MASTTGVRAKKKQYVEITASIPFELARAIRNHAPSDNTKALFASKTVLAMVRALEELPDGETAEGSPAKALTTVKSNTVNIMVMVPTTVAYPSDDDSDVVEVDTSPQQNYEDFALSKIEEVTTAIRALPFSDFDISPPIRVQTSYSKVVRKKHASSKVHHTLQYKFRNELKPIVLLGEQTVYDLGVALADIENIPLREQRITFNGISISVGTCNGIRPDTTLESVGIDTESIVTLVKRNSPYPSPDTFTAYFTVQNKVSGATSVVLEIDVTGNSNVRDILRDARAKAFNPNVNKVMYNGYKVPPGLTMAQFGLTKESEDVLFELE